MRISATAVFSANLSDKAGLQVLHIAQTNVGREVQSIGGNEKLRPGAVPLVTTPLIDFPSKYFRFLPEDYEYGSRVHRERDKLMEKYDWLRPASAILCINPRRLDPNEMVFKNLGRQLHYSGMIRAFNDFCGVPVRRLEPLPYLSAEEKKNMRISARRKARRDEHRLN
ncbi:MAG: hypothetical protein JWL82_557 [Parcubacteria group bacterium]|nr:hypothetical protein [Parcubacteria group bacterium]